ncbi:MAG: ABC transporter permease [Corynebacterium sp.]|nr:ABC transporter permease [Corynebacterium sp.]
MDNTITGLLHIPASRAIIGMAKLGVYLGWGMLVHMLLTLIIMLLGCCLGYGLPPTSQLVSLLGVGFATLIVTIPIAWGTARARSLIAGFGITIVLLILGQLGGLSALGGWIPPAFPALWALAINPTTTPQFLVALGVSGFFTGLICIQWSHMQLP